MRGVCLCLNLMEIWDWLCVSGGRVVASVYGIITGWFTFFCAVFFPRLPEPRQQWRGWNFWHQNNVSVTISSSKSHLADFLPLSSLSLTLSDSILLFLFLCSHSSLRFSPSASHSLQKPSFVLDTLWGLSGILACGKVIYNTALSLFERCDISMLGYLHVIWFMNMFRMGKQRFWRSFKFRAS